MRFSSTRSVEEDVLQSPAECESGLVLCHLVNIGDKQSWLSLKLIWCLFCFVFCPSLSSACLQFFEGVQRWACRCPFKMPPLHCACYSSASEHRPCPSTVHVFSNGTYGLTSLRWPKTSAPLRIEYLCDSFFVRESVFSQVCVRMCMFIHAVVVESLWCMVRGFFCFFFCTKQMWHRKCVPDVHVELKFVRPCNTMKLFVFTFLLMCRERLSRQLNAVCDIYLVWYKLLECQIHRNVNEVSCTALR